MKVLSLFDGISCGRVALERANIPVEKYYASEVDKYAIQVSEKNYPDIIHIGDVRNINPDDYKDVDMIIGGSPCQCFSFAGRRNGMTTTENIKVTSLEQYTILKQKHFQFEGQSYLFWEYVRILSAVHPKYFLLENVVMAREWNDIISRALGTIYPERTDQNEMFEAARLEPVEINSALVSAQNRRRLYWTNIPNVGQPKDKGIMLKDIIEDAETERDKSYCIDASYYKGGDIKSYKDKARRQLVMCGRIVGRNPDNPKSRKSGLHTEQMLEVREDEKSGTLTTVQKDNVCVQIGTANIKGNEQIKRVYSPEAKSPCLTTMGGGNQEPKITQDNVTWRKLTVTECERLQTLPDGYCRAVSNSRAYHAIGNGWTVDVIAHIFRNINWHDKMYKIRHSQAENDLTLEDNLLDATDI